MSFGKNFRLFCVVNVLKISSFKSRYGYMVVPFITYIVALCTSFYLSRLIVYLLGIEKNLIALPVDDKIPFVSEFIVFYILAYVQWFACYFYVSLQSRDACYRTIAADTVGKLITFVIFIVFPTMMTRAELSEGGIFNFLTSLIYGADIADNLFPSIHCFSSWIVFRALLKFTKLPKWVHAANLLMTLLVFASVVLVKQHVFIDIFGGVLVAEIGIFISEKLNLKKLFEKLEPKFARISVDASRG